VEKAIIHEERIQWVDGYHPEILEYVREGSHFLPFRTRRPGRGYVPGLVAYAVLKKDAPAIRWGGGFERRRWWLTDGDPYAVSGHPCEAVDLCSIRPGQLSLESDR